MKKKPMTASVFVYRGYDLRQPLEVKLEDMQTHADITVFLNRRHNLAHVFWNGEKEAWLRLPVPKGTLAGAGITGWNAGSRNGLAAGSEGFIF